MVTIYNNYYGWIDEDEVRQNLIDCERVDSEDEVTDEMVWDEIADLEAMYWDDMVWELESFFEKGCAWLLTGTIGRWDGNYKGGFIFNTFDEFAKCLKDCDYVKITDDMGHFEIECSHHDGTNYFEVKELTEDGCEWYDVNQYSKSDEELHMWLWESNEWTKLPHFAKRVYGCEE